MNKQKKAALKFMKYTSKLLFLSAGKSIISIPHFQWQNFQAILHQHHNNNTLPWPLSLEDPFLQPHCSLPEREQQP